MKIKSLSTILFIILIGCSYSNSSESSESTSSERSEIINWASQIASLENRLELVINKFTALSQQIASRPPTNDELSELTKINNEATDLYNEIIDIAPPIEVKSIHNKYIDNYSKMSESVLYYVIAIKQNDLNYFEKSASAIRA